MISRPSTEPAPTPPRWRRGWLRRGECAIVAGYLGLRLATLGRNWHLDEFASLEVADAPSFAEAMAAVRRDPHHPAFFVLLWLVRRFTGAAGWGLRLLPLVFEIVTLLALAQLLRRAQHQTQQRASAQASPQPAASFRSTAPARGAGGHAYHLLVFAVALGLWGANPLALRFASELRPYSALICTTLGLQLAAEAAMARHETQRTRRQLVAMAWACACIVVHPTGIFAVVGIFCAQLRLPGRLLLFGLPGPQSGRLPGRLPARQAPSLARQLRLLPAAACAVVTFAALHWGFTLPDAAARVGWLPPMTPELFGRIVSVCFGLEDSDQYGQLSRQLYGHGSTGCLLLAALLVAGLRAGGAAARAAGAAGIVLLAVVGYSAAIQPIFWYRAIAPAIVLACVAGALALARRQASGLRNSFSSSLSSDRVTGLMVAGAGLLVGWQVAMFLPIASRAVDPTQQAAQKVLAAWHPGEPIYVFPTWMETCLRPYATASARAAIRPLALAAPGAADAADAADAAAKMPPGVALVRCNADLLVAADGLQAALATWPAGTAALRYVVLIADDNDDLDEAAQRRRDRVARALQAARPNCRPTTAPTDRLTVLDCGTKPATANGGP